MSPAPDREEHGPILLFGMPRSGTTWLGKIFDSHPDTLYRHEPDGCAPFTSPAVSPLAGLPSPEELRDFVASLPGARAPKVAGTLPVFPKSYLSTLQLRWNQLATPAAKLEARLRGGAPARLLMPAAVRVRLVWKSIELLPWLGAISSALPRACGVLILRHPCGFVASVMRGRAQRRFSHARFVGDDYRLLASLVTTPTAREHGITIGYLQAASLVERLAWHWVLANDKALADTAGGDRILPLRYEDLCADPEAVARQLFDWCGLSWHRQTERFLRTSTRSHRRRYYSVFKDPAKAADAWRHELADEVQHQVMATIAGTRAGRLYPTDTQTVPAYRRA